VEEAQKNAMLLNEYHEIYELQRKRLEKALEEIAEEREMWIITAYNIALKITEENKLVTAKRLNLSEKSWSKLAKHFSLFIGDYDTKDLVNQYVVKESEKLNSDLVTFNEEKIKACEKSVHELVELCDVMLSRHKKSKDQEKIEKYMRYQILQNVKLFCYLKFRAINSNIILCALFIIIRI